MLGRRPPPGKHVRGRARERRRHHGGVVRRHRGAPLTCFALEEWVTMAYDETLADRIRRAIGPRPDVSEKKMFGGVAFLLDGKMFCGITKDDLMVRVGPDHHGAALAEAHVRPMDFT